MTTPKSIDVSQMDSEALFANIQATIAKRAGRAVRLPAAWRNV